MDIKYLKVGSRVYHNKFGTGKILEIDKKGEVLKILFDLTFEGQKERLIMASYIDSLADENNIFYNNEQLKIKIFLDSRNIKYLVHFTDSLNIESIKEYGLLSIDEMNRQGIKYKRNDWSRLDGQTDYISLSVTKPNLRVYSNYKNKGRIGGVCYIYVDAKVLYEEINTSRIYCDRNAAASTCKKGDLFENLENMFCDEIEYETFKHSYSYNRFYRRKNETTDPQAEILFFKHIDKKYIANIEKEGDCYSEEDLLYG